MKVEDYMLPCLSKKFLGVECFGCGTQRAFVLVMNGKFAEAFELFPAIYPMLFFALFVLLHFIDRKRNYTKLMIFFAIISAIFMVVSYFWKKYSELT